MFKKYKITLYSTVDNSVVDSTVLEYRIELKRNEVLKLVRTYLSRIGYGGKKFKFSLKKFA